MKISVIVPTLEEESTIVGCLSQPGLREPSADIEVIVCDGGSKDATGALAAQFAGVRVIQSARGRGTQMNRAAEQAAGEVLLFLHADCLLPPDWAAQVSSALRRPECVGGYFTQRTVARGRGRALTFALRAADMRSRFLRRPYGDSGLFVRRAVFERLGGFREIPVMEDYEFAGRLRKAGELARVGARITADGRRYERGLVAATLVQRLLPLLFELGVDPARLDKLYKAVR